VNLALVRKQKNMTQEAVAKRAKIKRSSYTNIERGRRLPSVEVAKRLGDVLGIDWTKFFE